MKLYRGTQRQAIKGTKKVTSWTPSLPVAVIYSARPGDAWGSREAAFLPTSTVHIGDLKPRAKVLNLCGGGNYCSFGAVLKELQYEKPDGISHAEAIKILTYMHNRLIGKVGGGDFTYRIEDEDGDEREFPLSLRETPLSMWRDEFDWDTDVVNELRADTYIFADAPAVRRAAIKLGFDAVQYDDVFSGGPSAAKELLGCDSIYQMEGVDKDWDLENEYVPLHTTIRPLHKDAIVNTESVSTESVLPEVVCEAPKKKAANPKRRKAKAKRVTGVRSLVSRALR